MISFELPVDWVEQAEYFPELSWMRSFFLFEIVDFSIFVPEVEVLEESAVHWKHLISFFVGLAQQGP